MVNQISFPLILALVSVIILNVSSTSLPSEDSYIFPSSEPLPLLSLRTKPDVNAASCSYRVEITTGCSSVAHPKDQISLNFGDVYGKQVYVQRIDNPKAGTFEACSTDTFDISGPCTRNVCYVYLYRRGHDGWNVGSVKISGRSTRTVTFNFKSWIPANTWYGFNYCNGAFASTIL